MIRSSLSILFVLASGILSRADVQVTELDDRIRIDIDGKLFTEWRHREWVAPYFYPVVGPNGNNITRNYPMKEGVPGESQDHPHHRSLRFAHSDVNGLNFWYWRPGREREDSTHEIVLEKVEKIASGKTGEFVVWNRWIDGDELVLREKMRVTVIPLANRQALMDYDIELHAGEKPVTFGDIKDGGMLVRVAGTMKATAHRKDGGGKLKGAILNSRGDRDANTWGKRAEWVDYFGPEATGKIVGIAMFDHPGNLRFPTHWHSRTYGLLTANRFGADHFDPKIPKSRETPCRPNGDKCPACNSRSGDYTIAPGEKLALRHRFYFHHGDTETAKVAEQFTEYSSGEWTSLFDGKSLEGWRGYKNEAITGTGWSVADGLLHCDETDPKVDLITTEPFENYELEVEWKTVPDGNGGIFIHADESSEKLPFNAPEIQLHAAGERELDPMSSAGALYALYPAKAKAIKPAGQWNLTRVIANGPHLEIRHNGVLTCKTEIGGVDWKARIANGKFADSPTFGTRAKGHIGLQDYGRKVWFRSIRLRQVKK